MSEKINVQCYKCKTVYELDSEMRGQVVECAVCLSVFTIPELQHKVETLQTNPFIEDSAKKAFDDEDFNLKTSANLNNNSLGTSTTKLPTETIKIKKTSQGMVPAVDDKFGVCEAHNPLYHSKKEDALKSFEKTQAKSAKSITKPPKAESKWWHLGSKKK